MGYVRGHVFSFSRSWHDNRIHLYNVQPSLNAFFYRSQCKSGSLCTQSVSLGLFYCHVPDTRFGYTHLFAAIPHVLEHDNLYKITSRPHHPLQRRFNVRSISLPHLTWYLTNRARSYFASELMLYVEDTVVNLGGNINFGSLLVLSGLNPTLEPGIQLMIACAYTFKPLIDIAISAWRKSAAALSGGTQNIRTIGHARQRPNRPSIDDLPSLDSHQMDDKGAAQVSSKETHSSGPANEEV